MADKKNSKRKSVAKSQFMHLYGAKLRSEILSTVSKSNASSQPERRVSVASAIEVANRSLAKTATYSSDVRYFSAIRSVNSFLALATRNKQTPQALSNVDLLPIGHPASTRAHAMTASALRHAQARWVAADPMIDDSVRALVASAHAARPGSTERAHAFARLSIAGLGKVPSYAAIDELSIDPIVAAFGLGLGGNSSAARRLRAQMQRRDRRGRFAFMGGGWSFNLRLPDGMFKAVSGRVVGQSGDDGVEIEVVGSKHLPNGVYTMPASKGESVAAILSEEAVKDLPDVDVYVGTDDVYMDSADLISSRMDAPSGWARNVTSTDGSGENARSISWENQETAYTVDEDLSASGERTGKLVLRQGLDGSLVARASNWGDVQKEIDADQPEYIKKLQAAEATRAEKEAADAAKAAEKAKVQSGEVPPYNLPAGSEWIKGPEGQWVPFDAKGNYDVSDEELAKRAENAAKADMGKPPKMFPKGFDEPTAAYTSWRNRVTKKSNELLENYKIARDHQRSLKGEDKVAKKVDKRKQTIEERINDPDNWEWQEPKGFPATGPGSWNYIGPWNSKNDGFDQYPINPPSTVIDAKTSKTGFDIRRPITNDSGGGEKPPTDVVAPASTPDEGPRKVTGATPAENIEQLQGAIDAGEEISFVYNGKERTITPEGMWENPKKGVTNVYGLDKDTGEKRTYTVEKMEAMPDAAPKAELAPTEVKPIEDGDIESLKAQVQSAIDAGETIAFDYNDKPRVFTPERIYFNPKNGNTNVAGFSHTDGEDRTFAIDNMSPPSGPIKPPAAEPAADLPPTPQKRFTNSGRQDLWDSIEAHQRSLMEKQPAPGAPTGGPGEPPTGGPGEPSFYGNDFSQQATYEGQPVDLEYNNNGDGTYSLDVKDENGELIDQLASEDFGSTREFADAIKEQFGQEVYDSIVTDAGGPGEPPTGGPGGPSMSPNDVYFDRQNSSYVDENGRSFSAEELESRGLDSNRRTTPEADIPDLPKKKSKVRKWKKGTDERWVNEDDKDQQDFLRSQGFKGDPPSKTQTWLDIDKEKLEELKAERNVPVEAPAKEVPAVEAAEPTADRKKVVQEIEDALAYREELRERNFVIDFEARTTEDPGDFDWNPDSDFSKQLVDEGLGKYLDFDENPRYGIDDDESRWDVSLDTDSMSDEEINTLADILNGDLPPEDRIPKVPGPGGKGPTPLSNADVPELRSQIDDAINNGDTITFTYNGKERTVRPQRTYFNPKNGSTNLVGFSEGDGEDRTFSLDKIEFPQAAPEEMVDPNQAFFEEEFDSMFDTPDGAYKPKIYEMYEPKGRQGQASTDYTDDPELLSTRFDDTELAAALRDAVLPSGDGDEASGQGSLPFNSGDESVPAEALYEALQYSGIDGDTILAGIYDSVLDPDRPETNVDRVNQRADEMFLEPSSSPLRNELPATNRSEEILRANKTSAEIGKVTRTEALRDTLRDYEETNPALERVADAIAQASADDVELDDMFQSLYPLSNGSEDDKQAFRGFWGMLMSLDGGDSPEDIDASIDLGGEDAGYRNRLLDQLAEMAGGDVDLAREMYNELIENYGGYPEFVRSREDIINGTADLDSKTTGAAFYRMAKAASKPNTKPLYRVINVADDDDLVGTYTTEGSRFYLDPRSWTANNAADGSLSAQLFAPGKGARIIFEALPGDIDSFDASTISPFPGENEHFAHGELEVVSIRRNKMRLTGGEEIIVQVRKAPPAPEAPEAQAAPEAGAPPSGGWPPKTKTYTGIEGWTKTGGGTGTNPGGFYRDQDGNEYYVKIPKSQSHADNETLAALLYEALGVPAAETSYGDENGELRLVSPIVPGSDPMGFFDPYESGDSEYLDQIRDHFVIDAWLANYDVIGYLWDQSTNIISDGNGNPIRVDPGASLMWRAQGKPKGDDRFSYDDRDLDTMRDPDINAQAASVFASTTDAQLQDAAMRLRDLTPSMIDQIIDANVVSESDRKVLKDKLKARRRAILDRFNIPEGIDDPEMFPDPVPLTESMGYAAQDLLPGDVTASDSFVIDKVFQDENTPSGKVSIQGYYPGHEMQRKEWNAGTVIEVSRGGTQPPMGDQPALHRPEKPRKPSSGAFTGRMQELLSGVDTWEEAAAVIRGTEIVYFDYETTGLSTTPGDGELNRPVQIGAVKVKDGKVIDRINIYMNPEFRLSQWSRDNLKQENGDPVTDEWLQTQPSMLEAHQQFLDFAGENPILGGQYVPFDLEVLQRTLGEQGLELDIAGTIDSKDIAAGSLPKWSSKSPEGPMQIGKDGKRRASNSLGPVAEYLGVELNNWHRADADAEASANIIDAMLDRAISNPDTPKSLLDTDGSFEAQRLRQAEYEAASEQYKQDLAEYEMSKAIAAAWNCGGSGIIASVGENGPCSIPSVDKLIEAASPDGTDSVDPDGVALGDPANPSSMADAADVDSPESDGKNVRDPYAGEAFPPTPQQREVVDAVLTGEDVKVLALAGTGKTSTLKLIARRLGREQPKKRIIYVAFNKSIQTEADATMPDNVESRTADSISYRAMPKEITSKIGSKSALVKAKDIGSHFGIFGYTVANLDGEREELSQFETIRALQKAITKYTNSADDEIGAQHFEDFDADDQMLDWANAIWADINSPKGVIRLTNSHITKMWALTRPDLSKNGSGLSRPADIIFFDEAQDINPVLGKVIADQTIQKIYVGDSNQAIYGFRGAVDQLEQVDAQYELPLTKSWRFGPQVAGIGNRFLTLIGAKQRIEGAGPEGVIVERGTMTDAQAVLVRTNIGAIKEISTELNNGRSVGVSKNFKDDLDSLSRSANWLMNGGPKPSKIHEEIAPFSSWAELQRAIADEETSQKLGTFLELIDEVGFDGLDEMLSRLKIYKSSEDGLGASPSAPALPELTVDSARTGSKGTIVDGVEYTIIGDMIALTGKKLFDNKEAAKKLGFKWDAERKRWAKSISSDNGRLDTLTKLRNGMGGGSQEDDRIDVVITTAHRAKGLEWDKVRIGDDFWGPRIDKDTGNKTMPSPEELKLDYVAVTRAKKELDPGGLEWVYAETSDADESPNMPEASAPEENIPPPPPSPEADAGDIIPPPPPGSDETALGAPEPDPEDGLSGTPETPDAFDPLDETPPYTGPVQDVNVINDEASVAQATYEGFDKDYADAVDALNAELVFLREEGNAKEKKAAKELQRAKDVIDRFNNGEISRAEAIEQLKTLEEEALERAKKSSGSEERVLNEQVSADIAEVRRVLDATASTGILVSKHYPPEGSGKGFDKNGVFIKIGDRVRDKWGYAGTVTRYNSSGGWNNIYIKKDVDGRDPNKIDPKKWGPGYIDSKGTGSVTVIKEGEDNSPYIPVPGKESKGPQRLDEQLAKLQSNKDSGDKGDDGLGVRPFMGPEDDDSGGAAGEPAAGTTEALRENVEARSEADAWSGEEESRTDTPKGEAPSGATAEAPELNNEPVKLRSGGMVVASVDRKKDGFLSKVELKPGQTFFNKEPIQTTKDFSAAQENAIGNKDTVVVRFVVPKGTEVNVSGRPKPLVVPKGLGKDADIDAVIEMLSEFHDPYEDLDFSLPAGLKFEVIQVKNIDGPLVFAEDGTGVGIPSYSYQEVVLTVGDFSVDDGPASQSPGLLGVDEADVDAAKVEPDWQIDTPDWDFEDDMNDLYEKEDFTIAGRILDDLPPEKLKESSGLTSYQLNGYIGINKLLRLGPSEQEPTLAIVNDIDKLDKMMEKAPKLPKDTVFYRHVSEDVYEMLQSLEVGDLYVDDAFTSTSIDDEASDDVNYEIYAPAGTTGVYVQGYLGGESDYFEEQEFLIDRGTTFRVVSKTENEDGTLQSIRFAVVEQSKPSLSEVLEKKAPEAPEAPEAEAPEVDNELAVSKIKDKIKEQKIASTDKRLLAEYKDVVGEVSFDSKGGYGTTYEGSEEAKAIQKYVSNSAGMNITTRALSSTDENEKTEYIEETRRRGQSSVDEVLEAARRSNLVTAAIEKAPGLSEETLLYRAIRGEHSRQLLDLKIGDEFINDSFSSTSINKKKATFMHNAMDDNKAFIVMVAPPGTKAFYVDSISPKDKMRENEVLLQRGTKYRIVGRDTMKGPYGIAPVIYVEIVSQDAPRPLDTSALTGDSSGADNSPEITTKLGTDISTPDVTQPDTKAAPDHTPQDYELIKKMIAEGPQAIGSEMTANWVKHIEEFRAKRDVDPDAEDDDAERGIDFVEKYDRSRRDELREDTEGDAFLQNLLLGISMFVETGPQRADKEWYNDSFIVGEEKTLTDLIDPSRESVRSFYTDIARYYENPDLIDQELTPASAFLRAVRSARKKDGEFARVLSFDKKISDPEHPLHKLLTVGQEIDLRPSSWTVGDNVGNLEAIVDKYHDALESDPVKRQKILDNTTNIILSVNGADAFDISKYGIREERESVLTNGRYRVTNVERVEVPLNSEMFHDDMYMAAVKISIEQIESPSAEEADAPEVAETDAGGGGGELPPTDEKITDTPEPEPNDDLSAAFQKQDTELKNKTEKAKEERRLKNAPLSDLITKILNSDFYESPDNPDKYKRIKSIGKNLGPASSTADHPIATLELPDLKILASYIDGYKKEKGSLTSDEQKILDEVNKAIEYASAPNARRGGNDRPLAMDLITADEFVDSVFDMGWIYPDGRIYPVRMAHENEHDYDESYEDGLIRLTGNREKLWGSKNKIKQIPGSISIENRDKAPNSDQAQTIETLLNNIPHGTLFIANSDNPDGRLVSPEEEKTDGVSSIFGVEDTEPEVVEDTEPEVVEDTTSKALPEPVKDEDGTWVGEIPYEELQKMKRTGSHPDKLPFFMQMGADPGDGYFWTRRGNRFWGRYGAAGTLVRYRDPETGEYRYLLGKRAAWISAGGGKWGIPGGAHKDLDANEEPTITAFAELKEELGIDLGDTSDDPDDGPGVVSEFHFSDLDPEWSYDTFIVDVPKSLATSASISDSETSEIGFFTLDELKKMADNDELHPAFAASIDEIIDLARDSETESRAEEAVNFDTSNIENIPSINSTLDTLRGSAMPRADVLVDGDDIEDTRVTFTKEIGRAGSGPGIVARFKLTSWAGDRARSERKDAYHWESHTGPNEIAFEKKSLSKTSGRAILSPGGERGEEPIPDPDGLGNDPMHAEYGTRHTYTDPEGRFVIEVYESDKDNLIEVGFAYNVPAWNAADNKVEIKFADDNPSEEVMKEAFNVAGVQDPRPARPEDIKALVENRLIAVFGGITEPDLNLVGSDREDALRQIKTRLGVTADDVEVVVSASGLIELKMPEAVAKKIVEKTGIEGFTHSFTLTGLGPNEVANKVIGILIANEDGTNTPGLLSTQERWDSGVQVTGASSNADMSTGGADYVFLGMWSEGTSIIAQNKKNLHKTSLAHMFFDPVEVLRNPSIWANVQDDYGMRNHSDVIGNIKNGGHELMVKRHLGPEAARSMYVSMDVRNAILEKLHTRGVTEINGIPVREFFKLFGDYEDKNEWKPGDALLDLNKLTGTIVKASVSKDKNVPDSYSYLSRIISRDGAYVQNEPYWTLPSFASDPMPILFMEKGSGRVIVFNRNKGALEIHEPSGFGAADMSAAGVKNLIEMVESGKIDDIAISFGTYGAAGVDLRMPSARDKFFEAEFARISTKLVAAKSTGEKKAALLELINLERANLSTQLRTKIAGFLNRGGPLTGELLAFAYDNRLPIGSKFAVNETVRQNPSYPFFIAK